MISSVYLDTTISWGYTSVYMEIRPSGPDNTPKFEMVLQTIWKFIYTLPVESPVGGQNGAHSHIEKCNRDFIFPQDIA